MDPLLTLRSVYQHVGGRSVLNDLHLVVAPGDWLLVAGPNGAGKSLLTRLLLGLDTPSAGQVRLFGQDPAALRPRAMQRLRRRMGAVLQGGSLVGDLTVADNLLLPLRAEPLDREARARAVRLIVTQLRLDGLENLLPGALSLGQRRRVELARALIHRPDLLVWDGLTDGLDRPGVAEIHDLLREQRETRALTLIATDNRVDLGLLEPDLVGVLSDGGLRFLGPPAELEAASRDRLELRHLMRGRP